MRAPIFLLAASMAALTACASGASNSGHTLLAADHRPAVASVHGDLLGGGTFDLADHRGEVVLVNFWGSWCAPCWAEADDLDETYKATKDRGVQFVGVNTRDEKDAANRFVAARSLAYPMIFDPPGKVALSFDGPVGAIPSTILIDRQGRVALVIPGAVVRSSLEPLVLQLAAEAPGG
jgi:peroxiredoxin